MTKIERKKARKVFCHLYFFFLARLRFSLGAVTRVIVDIFTNLLVVRIFFIRWYYGNNW